MNQGRVIGVVTTLIALLGLSAQAKEFPAVPGQFVVKLKNTTMTMSASTLAKSLGGQIKQTVNAKEGLLLIERPTVETQESAVAILNANPMVQYAEPNYIYRVVGGSANLPNDTELGKLWGLVNTGQTAGGDSGSIQGKAGIDIDATKAWMIETGSKNVRVSVIDTGVNYAHPDLVDNMFTNVAELNGQPSVDDDGNGCVDDIHGCDFAGKDGDPMDVYGHGTHVSGTIGATGNNNDGIVGVAWNVEILPVRFLGDDGGGTLADAVLSIDYSIAMKANIMSNSWGGGGFSQALLDAITRAKDAGILFVAAAGNSSNDNDASAEYPASYQVDNVIAVAALDPAGNVADFSNYGKTTVQLAAPGVNVYSYTMAGLQSWSGTSMACPHVSGVAALLLAQDGTQTYDVIRDRLFASARPLASLRSSVTYGMVNAYHALTNTAAPLDPNDPFDWNKSADVASTPHPYTDKFQNSWTMSVPGAARIAVHFAKFDTESGYDKVTFTDANGVVVGTMSGKKGDDVFGPVIEGDTVTVTFTADDSVTSYGFDIDGVAYQN
ncbi:MAG: S8 family serine peptidase [Bdellovibrionales bacterium]